MSIIRYLITGISYLFLTGFLRIIPCIDIPEPNLRWPLQHVVLLCHPAHLGVSCLHDWVPLFRIAILWGGTCEISGFWH